ncbi:SNF1 kinase complex beta-subunit [Mycena indigotica]|uniref:SNF1 kinase complex beta-subunit n=1 Tax=Mycena indigotica TaxID=2126181 RepID=A0A8H6SHC5_9AGAR|nr:SNF1 kinase complex beta-subunit [Mycena indigotica]KAF7298706.1 SNF1 kinase complex beta-subunit [Mycena indigotica]
MARRRAEKEREREREEEKRRGRSPTRSRSRHEERLRAPTNSPTPGMRSRSRSRSPSRERTPSRSRSRTPSRTRTRTPSPATTASQSHHAHLDEAERERQRTASHRAAMVAASERARAQEQANPQPQPRYYHHHTNSAASAYQEEVIFSTIPLTIGPAYVGAAEGDGEVDGDGEDEEDGVGGAEGGRSKAVAAMVDEIVGPALTPIEIVYRGEGAEVELIRAGDGDWLNRTPLERRSPAAGAPWAVTIHLPPGTHHYRFVVDGNVLVAPAAEAANAVDDQGFITNYVTVPAPASTSAGGSPTASVSPVATTAGPGLGLGLAAVPEAPTPTAPTPGIGAGAGSVGRAGSTRKKRRPSFPLTAPPVVVPPVRVGHPDGSFWDANSVDGSSDGGRGGNYSYNTPAANGAVAGAAKRKVVWTSEIPEELYAAQAQEEEWAGAVAAVQEELAARERERGRPNGHHHHQGRGAAVAYPPEPSIPAATHLPRHLERLILNRPSPGVVIPRVGTGAGNTGFVVPAPSWAAGGAGGNGNGNGGGRESPALRVTTASGTDVTMPGNSMMMGFAAMSGTAAAASASGNGNGHLAPPAPREHSPASAAAHANGGTPLIADDPSVLQTPSHAVLYHLCTSSIKDRMIAVGASTRYRQKAHLYPTTRLLDPTLFVSLPSLPWRAAGARRPSTVLLPIIEISRFCCVFFLSPDCEKRCLPP